VGLYAYAGGYAASIIIRRADIARAIAEAEAELVERRAQLSDLFAELKRYEIVLERFEARAAQEAARREAIALDELSLEMHRRGQG
jgi:flagellar export protein FliJ